MFRPRRVTQSNAIELIQWNQDAMGAADEVSGAYFEQEANVADSYNPCGEQEQGDEQLTPIHDRTLEQVRPDK